MVQGLLIDHWALGGRFWLLPQLLLHFGLTAKAGFHIPSGLGDQGVGRLGLKWVDEMFPVPFIARDLRKALVIIQELGSNF